MKAVVTLGLLFMLAAYATGVARAAEARKHDNCTWVAAMAEAASFDLHNGVKLERVKVIMVKIASQWGLTRIDALDLVQAVYSRPDLEPANVRRIVMDACIHAYWPS
jgi:hypothetical protein